MMRVSPVISAAAIATAIGCAAPVRAALVYERPTPQGDVVAAHNDGSGQHVIAHGVVPRISPGGHRVAYFVSTRHETDLYVIGIGGRHRRLLARGAADYGPGSLVWSADSRRIIVGRAQGSDAYLIDVRTETKRHIRLPDDFSSAAFAPRHGRFVTCTAFERSTPQLTLFGSPGEAHEPLGDGCHPVWGRKGLAFDRSRRILVRRHVRRKSRTLLRMDVPRLYPVDWSETGDRLLVFAKPASFRAHAVVISLRSGHTRQSDATFTDIDDLSRDGREILGVAEGNVVKATVGGTPRVLAYSAIFPSWSH